MPVQVQTKKAAIAKVAAHLSDKLDVDYGEFCEQLGLNVKRMSEAEHQRIRYAMEEVGSSLGKLIR